MNNILDMKKYWLFKLLTLCIPIGFGILVYIAYIAFRIIPVYDNVKTDKRGWAGKIIEADSDLGFVLLKNAIGFEIAPFSPPLSMRIDSNGFRIPTDGKLIQGTRSPVILFLGCSFTYGSLVPAEQTFAYLTADKLGGTSLNAGGCSYGLSQMLIGGSKLINEFKPDYVVIQYSDWLTDRAITPFAPTYYGKLPTPYFYGDKALSIEPPVFKTIITDFTTDKFRNTKSSLLDYMSFAINVGFPLFIHDDYNMALYNIKKFTGKIPIPTNNKDLVVKTVYEKLVNVARQAGSIPVIVVLGLSEDSVKIPLGAFPEGVKIINAHDELLKRLPKVDRENYAKSYHHWRGQPPVDIDGHPNPLAHKIIAEEIVKGIEGIKK